MEEFKTLSEQLEEIYLKIAGLENKVEDFSTNTEEKDPVPYSLGGTETKAFRISDIGTNSDGSIAWNDSELKNPPLYTKPPEPTKGYNCHFHTRYSGGALDIKSLEIVEYDTNWSTDITHGQHSQQFWKDNPPIKKADAIDETGKSTSVDKIGNIDFIFNPNAQKWGVSTFEIDLAKCYFVLRDKDGNLLKDVNGNEMKSLLYIPKGQINSISKQNEIAQDDAKNSVVWDKTAKCWRFYAVYAEDITPVSPAPGQPAVHDSPAYVAPVHSDEWVKIHQTFTLIPDERMD
jgi:hypothetical protein